MVRMSTSNKTEQEYILGHSIAVNDLLSTWQIFFERCSATPDVTLLFLDERDFTVRLGTLIERYVLDDREVMDARRFVESREAEPMI